MSLKTRFLLPVILSAAILFPLCAQSQEPADSAQSSPWSLSIDFASRYVWRGMQLSSSPVLQPSAEYSAGAFAFGAWGSHTFSKDEYQEVDLYASVTHQNLSLSLTDYYAVHDSVSADYLQFEQDKTVHTLEAAVTITGPEAFPAQLLVGTLVYGYDLDEDGKNLYSTYIELSRTWEKEDISITPFIGITPRDGYYSQDGFQLVNAGVAATREIPVTEHFSLPVNINLTLNPYQKTVFLTAMISL